MTDALVPVRSFDSRIDAEMARELLQQQGIPSFLSADDAGGVDPALQLISGVKLVVREQDLKKASQTLDADYAE
jgi:hypothetical protein